MIKDHPVMTTLVDGDRLWRFVDFTKFVSMLDSNALFFTRCDRLADKYEGTYSRPTFESERQLLTSMSNMPRELIKSHLPRTESLMRRRIFLNCWHINEFESAAMWHLYLKSDEGVAIQTTFKRLRESLSECPLDIYATKVQYLDYDQHAMPFDNALIPYTSKRLSFQHEREMRLIFLDIAKEPIKDGGTFEDLPFNFDPSAPGCPIAVDLDKLIERVFVAPSLDPWIDPLVKNVMKRYGIEKDVVKSDINGAPLR